MSTAWPAGEDRTARWTWLPSLGPLHRDYGIERVEVAIPTHFHDDHVAGLNLLRAVEGTEIWSEAGIARILADPRSFDLPCLSRDSISADRIVPTGTPLAWREYELTVHPLPGHCRDAVAVEVEVDGARMLATGDQQVSGWIPGQRPEVLNYQYRNGFRPQDYVDGARLYQRLRPTHLLTGHWGVRRVDDAYLDEVLRQSRLLVDLHEQLLARDDLDTGPGDTVAGITPYRAEAAPGGRIEYRVRVVNPLGHAGPVTVTLVVPDGWQVTPARVRLDLDPGQEGSAAFEVRCPAGAAPRRRVVLAANVVAAGRPLGQVAECLVDLR